MLKISNLSISYGDLSVINKVNLSFDIGVTCIIGESGSGKSSILNALGKQISFEASLYQYKQIDVLKENNFSRKYIAYLIQGNNFIEDMTCFDNIRFYAKLSGKVVNDDDIKSYLYQVGLSELTSKHYPNQLSGGERQRLSLAQALAKDVPIILCDEITASLDIDNKIMILELLKKIAFEQNKIIIITSHDEEIYTSCDKVYEIDEGCVTLKQEKSIKIARVDKAPETNVSLMKFKDFYRYVSSKLDRQKSISLIYGLISSIVVALCAFMVFYTGSTLSEQNRILNRLTENQINIINQTNPVTGTGSYLYFPENQCFDEKITKQIEDIKTISSLYPYYWISLCSVQAQDYNENEFVLSYDNKPDKTITFNSAPYEYSLIPYYSEQEFNNKMTIINQSNNDFGVYLNESLLYSTGLTEEDLIGATINVMVFPPVAVTQTISKIYLVQEKRTIEVDEHIPTTKGIMVELPVLGIVDFWYNEERAGQFIYCPIEYMEEIREDVTQGHVLTENEMEWKPNAFTAFVKDSRDLDNTIISIRNIDDSITTGNRYIDNKSYYQQKSYVEKIILFALFIVLISGSLLSYAYGIFYYQHNIKDIAYLKRNGLSLKEFKSLLTIDILYQFLSNIFIAIPILIIITYVGQIKLNMWRFGFISVQSLYLVLLLIIFGLLQSTISRVHYYKKIK